VICLKLAKMGGFTGCKKIAALCEGASMINSLGSSYTLGVGTAAIYHFWACTPNVEGPVGYGSPLERFVDDVIIDTIPFDNGKARVPDGPGLGVELDEGKLSKYGVKIDADLP
jgi:L-alanine-DL-glutamate epimerase-like enolase superfamily enzyme